MNNQKQKLKLQSLRISIFLLTLAFSAASARAVTYTVDNFTDNAALNACTAAANDCSLRGALNNANAAASDDVINFAPSLAGMTIILSGTELVIANNGTLRINGATSSQITISRSNQTRMFFIQAGANVQINALNITGGDVPPGGTGFAAGGGIYNDQGTLLLTNSTVYNNVARAEGGGIFNYLGTMTIINSTISGNSGESSLSVGGGLVNAVGWLTVINSTISGNSAGEGGGFSNFNGIADFRNTIIANSAAGGDCLRTGGTINAEFSLIEDGLGCLNGTNSNNLTGDPNLGALANNGGRTLTHALICPSIAVDSGSNALALDFQNNPLDTDQRDTNDFPRIFNSTVDRGAFERQQVCNQPPVAKCKNVTVTLVSGQTTAAADINDGSFDPDGDMISLMYSPPGPYPAGQTVVTLTVNDGNGGTDSCMGTVTVLYSFNWFNYSDLLTNPQYFNQVTAGSSVAVRFSLNGFKGDPYSQPPTSRQINCSTLAPIGAAQEIDRFAPDPFYSSLYDFYQTTWRTQTNWRFTCRRLTLYFKDGTTQSLNFYFN